MLTTVFYWILNMSILGSIAGLIVLGLRKIKCIPPQFIYVLWLIPLIRLWITAFISNKYSLMTLLSKLGARTVAVDPTIVTASMTAMNTIKAAQSYNPLVFGSAALKSVFSIGAVVWLIGFAALMFAMSLIYYFAKKEVKGALLKEVKNASLLYGNIYESERITSPAVYGIFHPKVLLPVGLSEEDTHYAVLHERAHIGRGDNFMRCVAIATACLHWFNPLVWVFLKCFFIDMELACDAKVMREFAPLERKQYAVSLIHVRTPDRQNLFASAFGGARIKVRVEKILSYRKLTAAACICLILLAAAIAAALLTNA
jgi:beta-lactamase regulating signal transducer with metallopeptidase domain